MTRRGRHRKGPSLRTGWGMALLKGLLIVAVAASAAPAAPEADPWTIWAAHDPKGEVRVDHAEWDRFLGEYLVTEHPSGIHRVRYGSVTPDDRKALGDYLRALEGTEVSGLGREEQKAYWINLYNALTVMVVLDRYPVGSIRDIDISPGLFRRGPWGAKLLTIQGRKVSLDDIEHRILRPLWKDSRIHYAVNCASLGCPNLQPEAYTRANTESLLEKGAREFVNHPRGVRLEGNRLRLSSIYRWFRADFGGSEESVLRHLRKHAEPGLSEKLTGFRGKISYDYDWRINEP